MKKTFSTGFLCIVIMFESICQTSNNVSGTVLNSESNKPLKGVVVTLEPSFQVTSTNSFGQFDFSKVKLGPLTLKLELDGYKTQTITFVLEEESKVFDNLFLERFGVDIQSEKQFILSEDELVINDSNEANFIAGLFQYSKDVYLKTAAYNFSQAWFRIRGYDSSYGEVNINGIPMNKFHDGRPQWANWGGLNDMFKNQTFTNGISFSSDSFGGLLGTTSMDTRPSEYRSGLKLSLTGTNKTYKGRVLISYASHINKNGWAYALAGSVRMAREGYISGTPYNSLAAFLAVEKEIDQNNSIYLTGFTSWNQRGKSSPITTEVFKLKGPNYNSYWGYQGEKKRNSRIKEVHEPVVMLSHIYNNNSTVIKSTLAYQFGYVSNSRLGYMNAMNPDPTYWKYLPSSFVKTAGKENYEGAYLAEQHFIENGQIDWKNLFEINALNNSSLYYVFDDKNEDKLVSFNSNLNKKIGENIHLSVGIRYQKLKSDSFALMNDLLGGKPIFDINPYGEGLAINNDLHNIERRIEKGSKFNYNYNLNIEKMSSFLQGVAFKRKYELFASIQASKVKTERVGKYKNGSFPESSFGSGGSKSFFDVSIKSGITYKFSGRHLATLNLTYFSNPPVLRNIFTNVRIRNAYSPDLKSEKVIASDLSYLIRSRNLQVRLTGFYSFFNGGMKSSYYFAEGIRGEADFVNELVTNISKLYRGFEWSISYAITGATKLLCAGSIGDYHYSNNPNLYLNSDAIFEAESDFGKTNLEGLKAGAGPQRGYSLGFEYNDPDYWWLQINGNYLSHNYLESAPLLRTSNFYLDSDNVPYIDDETGDSVSPEEVNMLLKQIELDNMFLVNLVGGKSWKIDDTYFGFFIAISNLFGREFRTGGFEQSRYANYPALKIDKMRSKPVFGPKYWFGNSSSFYLNLYVKF